MIFQAGKNPVEARACNWLSEQYANVITEIVFLKPSEWAEDKRYLPPSVTAMPGFYSFDVAPYLREIIDNFDPQSPIREVDFMKSVQIGATVGILENVIGYAIDHIQTAPVMLLTADGELAKLRMESYITPMIQASGLEHLIMSADINNSRRTGRTAKKLEWLGGGFLIPFGAQNANKLRSTSIQILLEDEIDAYPDRLAGDGDPCKLAEDRTAAYESSRKILRTSTPLISQTSKIARGYEKGDKRKYNVPCKHCNELQELVFKGTNEDGTIYGLVWRLNDAGHLIPGSVIYLCRYCQGEHTNDDKNFFYRSHGDFCQWIPTAEPSAPWRRSYSINALYSPVGMQTWETQVRKWLDAWDVESDRVRDMELLQQFYNNVLGKPFTLLGEALRYERVVMHRRQQYLNGEIPNVLATIETGGPVQILTAAVDVHKAHLDVLVLGWCVNRGFYAVEWVKFEGDCESPTLAGGPWEKLRELIETKTYTADDGKKYRVQLTLIDSQYNAEMVYTFCADYAVGVYPIAGRDAPPKSANIKEFSAFTSKLGTEAYGITVNIYKDRLAAALRREWDGMSQQAQGHPNFPGDFSDLFFKELTAEIKREKINDRTGQRMGWEWHRPGNKPNHAWDLCVYNSAALDMIALNVCRVASEDPEAPIDWFMFWKLAAESPYYVE